MDPFSSNSKTRRAFLGESACAAVGTLSMLSTILSLRQVNAAAGDNLGAGDDFKALVCIFLFGGNDSSNMIVPVEVDAHALYTRGRGPLALARTSLLPTPDPAHSGPALGLHPAMTGCKALYDSGNLAMLTNVGTLLAPATLTDYRARNAAIPSNLFSHNDQQVLWQTTATPAPGSSATTGWAGRTADLLQSAYNNDSLSMNVSLAGSNVFQTGNSSQAFQVSSSGAAGFDWANSGRSLDEIKLASLQELFNQDHSNMLEEAFADVANRSIANTGILNDALSSASDFSEMLPDTSLGRQLNMIARMIEQSASLGMRRQIFFAAAGGFDTHGPQLVAHSDLLENLSNSIKGFSDAMNSINMAENVTTFTASDFGRTFDSNGRGSDHGWGGHHLISGGAVRGGRIYGEFPDIALGNASVDTGRGRWLPTTSVDQYAATLAQWFGVPQSCLPDIFPNIGNFSPANLGFMA